MTIVYPDHLSWWCNLSREAFQQAIREHVPIWNAQKQKKRGLLDSIGARLMRDSWMFEQPMKKRR